MPILVCTYATPTMWLWHGLVRHRGAFLCSCLLGADGVSGLISWLLLSQAYSPPSPFSLALPGLSLAFRSTSLSLLSPSPALLNPERELYFLQSLPSTHCSQGLSSLTLPSKPVIHSQQFRVHFPTASLTFPSTCLRTFPGTQGPLSLPCHCSNGH